MSSDPVTLKSFFCDDDGRPVFDCCDPKAMGEALDEAAHLLPHALLDEARTGYARTVEQLFQVRLEDILISGWSSVSALKECIRQSRKRPDETLPFYLADHTLTSTHHPSLDVMLGPTEIARLPFEIDLSLELKAVQLGIRDGRIDSLESGRCKEARPSPWATKRC